VDRGRRRLFIEVAAFVGALALVLFLMYRARPPLSHEESRVAMGTLVSMTVIGLDEGEASSAMEDAWAEIERVDSLMTRYSDDSGVARLNARGGGRAERPLASVLHVALRVARTTSGAFDPTVAPLVDLWGFGEGMVLPEHADVRAALEMVDYERVRVDTTTLVVDLCGTEVDLDGVAKGYAVDAAVSALESAGVTSALVDAGGDIGLLGRGPRRKWTIGIKDPRGEGLLGVLRLEGGSVATSGDYQRFGMVDGVRYHHILNPRTGYPARGVLSATVVCDDCVTADALATAVFVMGAVDGMAFIEATPGVEGVIVSGDESVDEVLVSSGLDDVFEDLR